MRRGGLIALAAGAACCACGAAAAPPQRASSAEAPPGPNAAGPEAPPKATIAADPEAVSRLAEDVVRRLLGAAKPGERLVILLQIRDANSPVAAAVKAALGREPRIVPSVTSKRELGPVAVSEPGTGHVNAVEYVFEPRPSVVLLIRESKETGMTYVAARDAGPDPLAPPSSWTWTLEIPSPR